MHYSSMASTIASGLVLAGCAISPLPQDVTGIGTYEIVAQFRCEMRDVLKTRVVNAVRRRSADAYLADQIESGQLPFSGLIRRIHDKDLKGVLEQYAGATILYDFSIDMTEDNTVDGSATLTKKFIRGSDTVGFNVSSDHKRENTRTFIIDDTFEKLLTYTKPEYCQSTVKEPNYNYPAAGRTRLEDMVLTFLDLNQSGNLGTKPGGPKTPTLTDDLQFTTKYDGSVSPAWTATPIGKALQFTGLSGKLESSRQDLHRVTIVLSMPEAGAKPTPLTIAESRSQAQAALANANSNRTQIYIGQIATKLPSINP